MSAPGGVAEELPQERRWWAAARGQSVGGMAVAMAEGVIAAGELWAVRLSVRVVVCDVGLGQDVQNCEREQDRMAGCRWGPMPAVMVEAARYGLTSLGRLPQMGRAYFVRSVLEVGHSTLVGRCPGAHDGQWC